MHSDIKPDNILVQFDNTHSKITEIKLCDFGSSFKFDEMSISAATPEYLPPEVLIFLEKSYQMGDKQHEALAKIRSTSQSWSIDVWALGVILIEILTGFPLWLQYKTQMLTA